LTRLHLNEWFDVALRQNSIFPEKTFKDRVKNQFNIYMLSSSVDPNDIQRAKLNPLVIDIIEKPLNKLHLKKCLAE
jgi:hypothetical protein